MKKQNEYEAYAAALIGVCIMLILAICLIIFVPRFFRSTDESPESTPASSSAIEQEETPSPSPTAATPTPAPNKKFTLIESKEPTLQGDVSQSLSDVEKRITEMCTEETAVEGLKTFIGNQVYAIPKDAVGWNTEGPQWDTLYVQLYGDKPNTVDIDGWVTDLWIWPREERTGERIYVFNTESEIERAQTAWEQGQKILNWEAKGGVNSIILNGRLLEGAPYQYVDGEYYIPLRQVSKALDPISFYDDTIEKTISVPMDDSNGLYCPPVPYDETMQVGVKHDPETGYFSAGKITQDNGTEWSDVFRTGDTKDCYVPATELSRYTGWYIYTNGDVISIVTGEKDVTDNFIMNAQLNGSMSAASQLESGNIVIKRTDPNDKRLQDASDDEAADSEPAE